MQGKQKAQKHENYCHNRTILHDIKQHLYNKSLNCKHGGTIKQLEVPVTLWLELHELQYLIVLLQQAGRNNVQDRSPWKVILTLPHNTQETWEHFYNNPLNCKHGPNKRQTMWEIGSDAFVTSYTWSHWLYCTCLVHVFGTTSQEKKKRDRPSGRLGKVTSTFLLHNSIQLQLFPNLIHLCLFILGFLFTHQNKCQLSTNTLYPSQRIMPI